MSSYPDIPFPKFALAVVILTLPLAIVREESQQWTYVLLVFIFFAVVNYKGLDAFAVFLTRALKGG